MKPKAMLIGRSGLFDSLSCRHSALRPEQARKACRVKSAVNMHSARTLREMNARCVASGRGMRQGVKLRDTCSIARDGRSRAVG